MSKKTFQICFVYPINKNRQDFLDTLRFWYSMSRKSCPILWNKYLHIIYHTGWTVNYHKSVLHFCFVQDIPTGQLTVDNQYHKLFCSGTRIRIRSDPLIFRPPDPVLFTLDPDPTCTNGFIKLISSWTEYKSESTNSSIKLLFIISKFMPTYLKCESFFFSSFTTTWTYSTEIRSDPLIFCPPNLVLFIGSRSGSYL